MKIDYYGELSAQTERIKAMLTADSEGRLKLKAEGDKWRRYMTETLEEDHRPPINRRDLMSIIQNLGYILYEVWRLPLSQTLCAEGDGIQNELAESIQTLSEEIEGLKAKKISASRLRTAAYSLFSVWRNSSQAGYDPLLYEGYEATGDAMLRLADSLEMAG